jgi:hypothetical protein
MPWDEELTQLTWQVHDLFSQDVVDAAMNRAVAAAQQQRRRVDVSSPSEMAITCDGVYWTPLSAFHDALRTEFRRLLQPH